MYGASFAMAAPLRPECEDFEVQVSPEQGHNFSQTVQTNNFSNFTTPHTLNQEQATFVSDILRKMEETGHSDVVEW